jgi:hypothetical protein
MTKNSQADLEDSWKSKLTSPNFIIYMVTLLVGVGISIGTYQINISTTHTENQRLAQDTKEIREQYLRVDIYEVRHKALEDQLHEISGQIREIRDFLLKPRASNR